MKSRKFKKISKNIYKVENVFPEKVAEKIFSKFNNLRSKSWKLVSQKKNHYSHVFKISSEFLFKNYCNKNAISLNICRVFNLYGKNSDFYKYSK